MGRIGTLAAALGVGLTIGTMAVAGADTGAAAGDSSAPVTATGPASQQDNPARRAGARRQTNPQPAASTSRQRGPVSTRAAASAPTTPRDNAAPAPTAAAQVGPASDLPVAAPAAAPALINPSTTPLRTAIAALSARARIATPAVTASPVTASPVAAAVAAAPTAPVLTAAAPAPAASVRPAVTNGLLAAVLAPLLGAGSGAPVESPAAWAMLAGSRRFARQARTAALGAGVSTGQAPLAAAVATGTTTTITWAWGTNPVINFNPATDKLDFGWMQPTAFDVTETAGSTKISIVGNNHTYTLANVPISALSMTNIIAKDTTTVTKWQNLITTAQSTTTPSVSIADATAAEGNTGTTAMPFTVSLSKASTKTVTVAYATANGTATAGSDFTAASGTLTFAPGVVSQKLNVSVAGDTAVEPNETFTVKLSSPANATLGTATATGTITNDDAAVTPPTVSVAGAAVAEGNAGTTTLPFTVSLSKAATGTVTVGYATSNGTATAGSDYTATSGTLTFAPGVTSQKVNVAVTGDTAVEGDETVGLTLTTPSGATLGTATATGTITNDDVAVTPPTVSVANATVAEGNSGTGTLAFTVSLSKAATNTVTVGYATANGTATAGQDYTAGSGTLTFAPGVTSQQVNVAVTGDTVVEPDETLSVTLSNASGATLGTATATGTITNDDAVPPAPGTAQWGNAFFAPYVDMGGWPVPDLLKLTQTNGGSLFTAAFMQATPDGKLAWAGIPALAPDATGDQALAINNSIKALKTAGGDVMISLGGQAGTSLAQWGVAHGMTAQQLANAYAGVIDTYGISHLDFDIEGAAVAEPASIALNSQALKLLQQAKPDVQVWYTLPVLPTGLTADGINVVKSALGAGVKLAGVNVMAMDYGESAAPTSGASAKTMGAYAIQSAESTYTQLSSLYSGYGQTFSYKQLGVTPMLGVNDVISEVFTTADAQALENYARSKGLGMLAMWSATRDVPGTLGQATPTTSGVADAAGSFAKIFNDYGAINTLNYPSNGGGSGTPVTGGTTTTINWSWGTNTVLNFNTATDKLDFGWFQPTNFDVADVSGSTKITIVGNNQTYTLNNVPLSKMSINNIVALDSNTVAKWQNAIAGAGTAAPATTTTTNPTISIAGAAAAEGNTGAAALPFTVSLSKASANTVTVGYATANGTATAGQDYTATTGTLTFAPGVTTQKVNVSITGDTTAESNETFTVTLTNPSGATLASAAATGTINDDDTPATPPTVSVANATVAEGNSGTAALAFTVSLSKAATSTVTVGYTTANGTATAGQDYTAKTGTLTFAPGVTSQQVNVSVIGDATVEPDETLTVALSNASGATVGTATATGTITNDDTTTPTPAPATSIAQFASTGKVLEAYYPEWGVYSRNFQPADIPGDQLTHIVYSFLNLTPTGDVAIYDSYAALEKRFTAAESVSGEADLYYYPPSDPRSTQTVWGNFNQLAQLKKKYPNLRVNIALGGWTLSSNFSTVASTAAGREKLANSIVNFLTTYQMFDGIDFDWEYPGGGGLAGNSASPNDGANYAALLQLVRTKLDTLGAQTNRKYEISVASPGGSDKIANFNLAGLAPSVDYFNVMSYDFHGTWDKTTGHQSAFTGDPNGYDIQTAINLYLKAGVNPNKIVLGAPLYTRAWAGVADGGDGGYLETASGAAPGSFEAGNYDYKDVLAQYQDPASGWKLYWDDNAQAAYLYNKSKGLFSSFETPTSIAQKSEWAQALGLRGMMFWDISNDAVGSPESLVKAAYSSWVLHDSMATIRNRSALRNEVIIGGDGAINALPTSIKL